MIVPARLRPPARRALAAGALAVALAVTGPLAGPAGAQDVPAPSTEPVPADDGGTETSTTVTDEAGATTDDGAVEEAQDRADADLRSVWIVVAALAAVALGLLVLLVLYVRATNPARAAARRAELIARAEERRRARSDGDEDGDEVSEAADERPLVAAGAGRRRSADRAVDAPPPAPGAPAAVAPTVPAVLSRDPVAAPEEAVRVLGDALPPPVLAKGGPVLPESTSAPVTEGTGAGRRRRTPGATSPSGSRVTPVGPPPGPAAGDETVRIVPAPMSPAAGAVVSRPAGGDPGGDPADRPPPRSLVDSPPPPRRPRRVEAPAKRLGTPDAERVLVRPGQTPVRVPPSLRPPGAGPDEPDAVATEGEDDEDEAGGDAR